MPPFLSVKGLDKWQHYKRRNPPWIKLYNSIFNDYSFSKMNDCQKFQLIALWSLASVMDNKLPDDPKWLGERIGACSDVNIEEFISRGFIERQK